jgi:hypothetical protein
MFLKIFFIQFTLIIGWKHIFHTKYSFFRLVKIFFFFENLVYCNFLNIFQNFIKNISKNVKNFFEQSDIFF